MKKILSLIIVTATLAALFLFFSDQEFSSAINRDFFPHGRPKYFKFSDVSYSKNVSWIMFGGSLDSQMKWIQDNDWGDSMDSDQYFQNCSSGFDFPKLIWDKSSIKSKDVKKVYSKIVNGADVGVLFILKKPSGDNYSMLLCVVRS
jgi:hypothetical protein